MEEIKIDSTIEGLYYTDPPFPEWACIAADLLMIDNPDDINNNLFLEIDKVAALIHNAGGRLRSRQVIAMIIVNWKNNNNESPIIERKNNENL